MRKSTVHEILQSHKYHLYKPTIQEELTLTVRCNSVDGLYNKVRLKNVCLINTIITAGQDLDSMCGVVSWVIIFLGHRFSRYLYLWRHLKTKFMNLILAKPRHLSRMDQRSVTY